jgi:hypothetical protein
MKKIILAVFLATAFSTATATPFSEAAVANARGDYAAEQKSPALWPPSAWLGRNLFLATISLLVRV